MTRKAKHDRQQRCERRREQDKCAMAALTKPAGVIHCSTGVARLSGRKVKWTSLIRRLDSRALLMADRERKFPVHGRKVVLPHDDDGDKRAA